MERSDTKRGVEYFGGWGGGITDEVKTVWPQTEGQPGRTKLAPKEGQPWCEGLERRFRGQGWLRLGVVSQWHVTGIFERTGWECGQIIDFVLLGGSFGMLATSEGRLLGERGASFTLYLPKMLQQGVS